MLASFNMVYECFCNGLAASIEVFSHIHSMDRQACHCSEMAELMDVRFKEFILVKKASDKVSVYAETGIFPDDG